MSIRFIKNDLLCSANSRNYLVLTKYLLFSHTIHLTILFRIGQSAGRVPLLGSFFRIIIEYMIRLIFASDISCRAKIGPGLSIIHGHDIVIGAHVTLGSNTKIFNGVTFGNKDTFVSSHGNQPVAGDNCVFCTGAKVLGPIRIGNKVIVGANSVLIRDCDDNVIVAGVPARVIKSNLS